MSLRLKFDGEEIIELRVADSAMSALSFEQVSQRITLDFLLHLKQQGGFITGDIFPI